MAIDTTVRRSRRAVLGAALGGAAAAAASGLIAASPALADTGDNAVLGQANTADAETSFENTTPTAPSLGGTSVTGTGVVGTSTDATPTVDWTVESHKTGMYGVAGDPTNAISNTDETGVYGFADVSTSSRGVFGESSKGTGVVALGDTGLFGIGYWGVYATGRMGVVGDVYIDSTGVYGFSGSVAAPTAPAGVGVYARAGSTSQTALQVVGKVKLNRSGRASVSARHSTRTVTMSGVTTSSYVVATLQTNVSGLYVRAVVPASGSFKIYLSKSASKKVWVGFVVIN
jgi:hypothetical protein